MFEFTISVNLVRIKKTNENLKQENYLNLEQHKLNIEKQNLMTNVRMWQGNKNKKRDCKKFKKRSHKACSDLERGIFKFTVKFNN